VPDVRLRTNGHGWTRPAQRASGELEGCAAKLPGYHVAARCFGPLAGQNLRLHLIGWPLPGSMTPYVWKKGDGLKAMADLCGHSPESLQALNQLGPRGFKAGTRVILPCWAASCRLQAGETWDDVAARFGYRNTKGLTKALGLQSLGAVEEVVLPDWHFFYARHGDRLSALDAQFGLSKGSVRTVGRTHHPDPDRAYAGETLAVPVTGFVIGGAPKRRA